MIRSRKIGTSKTGSEHSEHSEHSETLKLHLNLAVNWTINIDLGGKRNKIKIWKSFFSFNQKYFFYDLAKN